MATGKACYYNQITSSTIFTQLHEYVNLNCIYLLNQLYSCPSYKQAILGRQTSDAGKGFLDDVQMCRVFARERLTTYTIECSPMCSSQICTIKSRQILYCFILPVISPNSLEECRTYLVPYIYVYVPTIMQYCLSALQSLLCSDFVFILYSTVFVLNHLNQKQVVLVQNNNRDQKLHC